MEPLKLINSKKEWFYLISFLIFIFSFNLFKEYQYFQSITKDEYFKTSGKIINIYPKKEKQHTLNIAKIETDFGHFFTTIPISNQLKKHDHIEFIVVTQKLDFIDFIKGGFLKTFSVEKIDSNKNLIAKYYDYISSQHDNSALGSLFNTLFFATSLDKNIQNICSVYGISHIVAISGFHLGIISLVLYFLFNLLYTPIHQKYFPYRNKKFDILISTSIILFLYLLIINLVPSFLRAFLMFIFGILLLRSNIKLISFGSLAIIVALIIAFLPKLIFLISLWFSVAGVFYIFLYLQYFSNLNKYFSFIFFNFWIFFTINPITHYFFGTTSIVQFLSPLITLGFSVFYPVELLLHIINLGGLFDFLLLKWINLEVSHYEIFIPIGFVLYYLLISFGAIFFRYSFYLLNTSALIANIYIYSLVFYY